jgi:hypothetical protein
MRILKYNINLTSLLISTWYLIVFKTKCKHSGIDPNFLQRQETRNCYIHDQSLISLWAATEWHAYKSQWETGAKGTFKPSIPVANIVG